METDTSFALRPVGECFSKEPAWMGDATNAYGCCIYDRKANAASGVTHVVVTSDHVFFANTSVIEWIAKLLFADVKASSSEYKARIDNGQVYLRHGIEVYSYDLQDLGATAEVGAEAMETAGFTMLSNHRESKSLRWALLPADLEAHIDGVPVTKVVALYEKGEISLVFGKKRRWIAKWDPKGCDLDTLAYRVHGDKLELFDQFGRIRFFNHKPTYGNDPDFVTLPLPRRILGGSSFQPVDGYPYWAKDYPRARCAYIANAHGVTLNKNPVTCVVIDGLKIYTATRSSLVEVRELPKAFPDDVKVQIGGGRPSKDPPALLFSSKGRLEFELIINDGAEAKEWDAPPPPPPPPIVVDTDYTSYLIAGMLAVAVGLLVHEPLEEATVFLWKRATTT